MSAVPSEEDSLPVPKPFQSKAAVPLEPFARQVQIPTAKLKYQEWQCREQGIDSGIVREDGQWWVRPRIFYENVLKTQPHPQIRVPEYNWDGNQLLREQGLFFLRDVCRLLPFSPNQLRYQCQKHQNPRESIGIFIYRPLQSYLVDMPKFSAWIIELWQNPKY